VNLTTVNVLRYGALAPARRLRAQPEDRLVEMTLQFV